jgi:hypothetical protein
MILYAIAFFNCTAILISELAQDIVGFVEQDVSIHIYLTQLLLEFVLTEKLSRQ